MRCIHHVTLSACLYMDFVYQAMFYSFFSAPLTNFNALHLKPGTIRLAFESAEEFTNFSNEGLKGISPVH